MNYFVVWPDGQKFGPADVATLNSWVAEGRVTPTTELEVEGTGQRVTAGNVAGLVFPLAPAAEPAPEPTTLAPSEPTVGPEPVVASTPESEQPVTPEPAAPAAPATPAQPASTRVSYYVVWPDGQKFGPADVDTLTQWAAEGRLSETTELEVVETGARIPAGSVDGLIIRDKGIDPAVAAQAGTGPGPGYATPGAQPYGSPQSAYGSSQTPSPYASPPGPGGSPYSAAPRSQAGQTEAIISFVLSGLTFLTCCSCLPFGIGAIVLGVIARNKGNSLGTAAMIAGIVATLFSIGYWSLSFFGAIAGNLPGM